MKRIFSYLFAIITLVGTTGVFTSCQEDAVEIDYTISVTVNNDLTEVINAINNGNLSTNEGIQSLVDAINKLSGDQETKYQALLNAINGLATTLEAKLAVLEAAMQAQALALEGKLDLLAAAIEALPDYTEKLDAIEAAIKALPDYSEKLAAIETAIKALPDYTEKLGAIEAAIKALPDYSAALEEIKEAIAALPDYSEQLGAIITAIEALPDYSEQLGLIQAAIEAIPDYTEQLTAIQTALEAIKQQNSDNATAIAALQASIDDIAKAVEEGNKSQEDALKEIIALLESGAIAGGGSGSGGEDEWTYQSITITTSKAIGETIIVTVQGELAASEVEGAVIKDSKTYSNGYTEYTFELKNQTVTIKQASIAYILFTLDQITSVDLNNSPDLKKLYCYWNAIKGENMTNLVNSLPNRTGKTAGKFMVYATGSSREENVITKADVAIAKAKNWNVIDWDNNEYEGI